MPTPEFTVESSDGTLVLHVPETDNGSHMVAMLIFRATDEIREQVIERLPTGKRAKQTVQARMDRMDRSMVTPLYLLKGVR